MFRGYGRTVIDAINACGENNTYVPALAYTFSGSPIEITVRHEERGAGESKYSFWRLLKLNFDLMTGFSTVPMQLFSLAGSIVSGLAILFAIALVVRRLVNGPDPAEQGMFTLFAIAYLLIGVTLFGIGLLGEYIGRIYEEVRRRPRFIVGAVLEKPREQPIDPSVETAIVPALVERPVPAAR